MSAVSWVKFWRGKKPQALEKRSTATKIIVFPRGWQARDKIYWNMRPGEFGDGQGVKETMWGRTLILILSAYRVAVMKTLTSTYILGHQKCLRKNSRVLEPSGWLVGREEWPHCNTWAWTEVGTKRHLAGPFPGSGSPLLGLLHCHLNSPVHWGHNLGAWEDGF